MLLFHLLKAPSTTRWLLFWVSLFEAWIGLASPQPRRAPETVPTPAGLAHRTRIVARYSIQPREGDLGARLRKLGLRELKRFSRITNLVVLDEELPVDPRSQTTPEQRRKHLLSRIQQLQETGLFDYVEPDYLHVADAVPNDSAFSNGTLWGLRNQGQSGGLSGADIDAVRAWDITTGSTDVIVAVIDTGIRYTHQDLSAQMWQNPGESGALASDGIDNDGNGYVDDVYGINAVTGSGNPMDDNGHGTHCAGTIGAAANGSGPHVGVAWNVRLMGLKFMDAGGSGFTSDAIECINFAVAKGARVLSCSWGGGGYETSLKDAITRARNEGVLLVAAAGNESANSDVIPHYPSGYDVDNVISVAALDRSDNLPGFSNYGSRNVDVGAPGVDIYSTYHTANDAYATSSGTSMATPHVAGVAALVISKFPGISVFDLSQRLLATTVPVASLNGRSATGGRVNAYNALTASPNGTLEVSVSSSGSLIAGQSVKLVAQVTDLTAIGNATVTGSATGLPSMTFRNDGVSPDTTANDHLYCASFTVPSDRDQLVLTVQASAPSKTTQTVVTSFSIARPAANDNFSAATDLAGNVIQATGNNQVATKESGEPNHAANNVGGKSVWWKWTAPSAGTATINTRGSTFDTILGIYTGTAVNSLTLVASNDDETYPNVITSRVQFTATGGTTYRIAVDGYNNGSGADSGSITLNIAAPPANDLFANRAAVAGGSWQQAGSNLYATKETAEPNHANNAGGQSVWWTWTAPANGPVVLQTSGSVFDTLLAVYTGSTANSLTMVASNDDSASGTTSWLSFTASAGATYQIAVDGKNTGGSVANGSITLSLSQSSSPALAPVSNITTDEGQLLGLTLTATDADTATQNLTFSLVSGPSGMSVTGAGRLTWLPSEAQGPGSYSVTVAVSDGVSSATGSFTVTVREVNASPALTAINNQTVEEGSTLSLTLSATDADLPAQTLTFSLTSGPTGMTVTSAGVLTWNPTETQGPGSYTVTVAVSDGVTSATRSFTVTVNEVNAAPVFAAIPDQTLDEGQVLALTLSATDADLPAQTLTFSLTSGPTGMTVTSAGVLTWNPTEAQGPSTNVVTVAVTDGVTAVSRSFTVTLTRNTIPLAVTGTVIDGYIAGGFVWFDANLNGAFDTAEPNSSTDRQGNFSLNVDLSVFDTNRNGQIDLQEGRIIAQGGMDLGTGVKLQGQLMAPPGASVVTPLTTLVDSVARASGQDSIALAEATVQRSLGLPEVSLTQFDPISSALQGNRQGVILQAAAARVADTVSQIATLLSGLDPSVNTQTASTIVTDQIAKTIMAVGSLELQNTDTIHSVLLATVSSVGTSIPEATASRIAEAISEQNTLKIAAASEIDPVEALRQITQIQTVVQTDVTRAILDLATNPTGLDGFTIQFTGDTLLAAIDKAPVGDLAGTLSSAGSFNLLNEDAEILESGDSPVPLTVVRRNGASGIVTVEVVLNPSEGLRTNRVSLRFADGEIQRTISPSMLVDDDQLPGITRIFKTTLLLQAGSAASASVENPSTGTLRVVDNDAPGTLGFAQKRYELREQPLGQPSVVIRRQDGTAGSITAIVSIGSETGTAGRDYLGGPMTVTFAPGELIKILPPFVLDDSDAEANEILTLTLRIDPSSPPGARVRTEDSSTEIVLVDDDLEPRLVCQAAAGGIELLCFGPEGSSYDLQSSSDLQNWITIPGSPVTTTGFTKGVPIALRDTSTTARFFRIRSP